MYKLIEIPETALIDAGGGERRGFVAGWTRKAATLDDASNDRFQAGAGVGPNPAATSVLFIAYIDMTTTPGATRKMWYSDVNAEFTSPQLKTLLQKLHWPIK